MLNEWLFIKKKKGEEEKKKRRNISHLPILILSLMHCNYSPHKSTKTSLLS